MSTVGGDPETRKLLNASAIACGVVGLLSTGRTQQVASGIGLLLLIFEWWPRSREATA